jgi:hypothetical protein
VQYRRWPYLHTFVYLTTRRPGASFLWGKMGASLILKPQSAPVPLDFMPPFLLFKIVLTAFEAQAGIPR